MVKATALGFAVILIQQWCHHAQCTTFKSEASYKLPFCVSQNETIKFHLSSAPIQRSFSINLTGLALNQSTIDAVTMAHRNNSLILLSSLENEELALTSVFEWHLIEEEEKEGDGYEEDEDGPNENATALNHLIEKTRLHHGKPYHADRNLSENGVDHIRPQRLLLIGIIEARIERVGRTNLSVVLLGNDSSLSKILACKQRLVISSPDRVIDRVFNIVVLILVLLVSSAMGAMIDLHLVRQELRKPTALIVGFCCQYFMMPLIAVTITTIFKYPQVQGLGLFIVGCCPGGTNSNQWTVLFDGDIGLSAVMTLISTSVSLIAMPVWLSIMGRHYVGQVQLRIPYWMLSRNLLFVIGPYVFGIAISHFVPRVKIIVLKLVKPMVFLLLVFFTGVGTYVNFHLFKMLKLKHALTAPLLPWSGFGLGFLFSTIFVVSWKQVRTIAIETGFQNVSIAMLIIQGNLPPPEREMASVIILITGILSSLPMILIYIPVWLYSWCTRRWRLKNHQESAYNIESGLVTAFWQTNGKDHAGTPAIRIELDSGDIFGSKNGGKHVSALMS